MYGKRRNSGYISFLYFFHTHWDIDDIYTIHDISSAMEIPFQLARYYLMSSVKDRRLCRIKYGRHTYFAHRWTAEVFRQFKDIKVIDQ